MGGWWDVLPRGGDGGGPTEAGSRVLRVPLPGCMMKPFRTHFQTAPIFCLPTLLPPLEGFWLPEWGLGSLGTGAQTVGSC